MDPKLDLAITVILLIYGLVLIAAAFIRNRITEAMRIDALFMPQPTEKTRILNLFFGIIIVGYMVWSLLK